MLHGILVLACVVNYACGLGDIDETLNQITESNGFGKQNIGKNPPEISQSGSNAVSSPFFFLCHTPQSGQVPSTRDNELSLSFKVAGNKSLEDGYTPQEVYEVQVATSELVDGFLITGAHSITKEFSKTNHLVLPPSLQNQNSAGLVCSIVHRHISMKPRHDFSFLWFAPPTNSGCVRFLATGSLRDEVIYSDVTLREICEKRKTPGDLTRYKSPYVARNTEGFVLRDDFDNYELEENIWQQFEGGTTKADPSSSYGLKFYGTPGVNTTLQSHLLDFTPAQRIRYAIGRGECKHGSRVVVSLGSITKESSTLGQQHQEIGSGSGTEVGECTSWKEIASHDVPGEEEIHILSVPGQYRRKDVCIKFDATNDEDTCFSLDNIAITKDEPKEGSLVEEFDPVQPENWIFISGGEIKESCGSEGHSAVFTGTNSNWLTSRKLDLSKEIPEQDVIFQDNFRTNLPENWNVIGKAATCGNVEGQRLAGAGERKICSPNLDLTKGNIFTITVGTDLCKDTRNINLEVQFSNKNGKISIPMGISTGISTESFEIPSDFKQNEISVCIEQPGIWTIEESGWFIYDARITPRTSSNSKYFLQALINTRCGDGEAKVKLEASTSGGRNWFSLDKPCSSTTCDRNGVTTLQRTITSKGWSLITIRLPYESLTSRTIFRVKQIDQNQNNSRLSWAIDNIFIGDCPEGCSGHGICQASNRCKCEYGWSGKSCSVPERGHPFYLSEPFSNRLEQSANILTQSGGHSSYQCGVVGSGKAAVFDGDTPRFLTTSDMNTTEASLLQFNFLAGTESDVGKCPGPRDEDHSIYIHYSCSGGAFWHLLGSLKAIHYKKPSHVSYRLPSSAKGDSCRFEIWQPEHNGERQDMWAIDDLTLTSESYNTIELPFDNVPASNQSLRFHLGKIGTFCGKEEVLHFTGLNENGLTRFMETKSIGIGPSFMVQFDLKIGCQDSLSAAGIESTIVLEYSLTHGLTWNIIQKPCTPSKPGCELHFSRGTTYHSSEFSDWKRVTMILPQHTWSPTARLRLRQLESTESGLPWAVDNLYIGYQCSGLCSGHGYCTSGGCRCDDNFHGHKCLPVHKLHYKIDSDFEDEEEMKIYGFHYIGGHRVGGSQGCGKVLSGHSLYFGEPGIRQFESDDMKIDLVEKIMFALVIGGGNGQHKSFQSDNNPSSNADENLSFGSLVLEYSTDGGITWTLLKELIPDAYRTPKQFQMDLDDEILPKDQLESRVVRFRLWQPNHKLANQWAIDSFKVLAKQSKKTLQADFKEGALLTSPWLSSSEHSQKEYCHSTSLAVVMASSDPIRMAVTDILSLNENDIISFEISVGCKEDKRRGNPVRLEFSRDNGNTWDLVQKPCLPGSMDCENPSEPSIYWPGHHGPWTLIQIPVNYKLSESDIHLRWIQENPTETAGDEFALQKVYIGPPCPKDCSGHGLCKASGLCSCDSGFSGKFCENSTIRMRRWLKDSFDLEAEDFSQWKRIEGGSVTVSCGNLRHGKVLMFDGDQARFLTTKELDTRAIKFLVFHLQIGGDGDNSHCRKAVAPRDNVMLEYSTNNGISWNLLQEFEPQQTLGRERPHFIALPRQSRTKQTTFRWWQIPKYLLDDNQELAEWEIDNVFVMANETTETELHNTNASQTNLWFLIAGTETSNNGTSKQLTFSDQNGNRYAETWDFMATEASAVQFGISMNHNGKKAISTVNLEYSIDNGRSWSLIRDDCTDPFRECEYPDLASVFMPGVLSNTRITTSIPRAARGRRTRIRLREVAEGGTGIDPKLQWTLSNMFIGDSCPWMCSGHGYCDPDGCRCDPGYFGEYCVPEAVLPCEMFENFESEKLKYFTDSQGAEFTNQCGVLVHNKAAVFMKTSPRYITTIDLDMTGGQFVQFTISTGCAPLSNSKAYHLNTGRPSDKIHILIQYSINGGIEWTIMKELVLPIISNSEFISVLLNDFPESRTNATRFRFWQPGNYDTMSMVWSIDNVYIGGLISQPNVLYDEFNSEEPNSDAWIDWPAGQNGYLCDLNEPVSAIVFKGNEVGEHAIYTKDIHAYPSTIVQFDVKIGCGNITQKENRLELQYSNDFGESWHLLRPGCSPSEQHCSWDIQTPSVYYPNSAFDWERVTIPLSCLPVCGDIRLRWYQGYYQEKQRPIPWGIDNVYIGPACESHCYGHGYCINGDTCDCDIHYTNHLCASDSENVKELSENFETGLDLDLFIRCSGSDISVQCPVISGENLFFWHQGERVLETTDMDVTDQSVVEFYVRIGCFEPWQTVNKFEDTEILFSFSKDGGIHWKTLAKINRNARSIDGLSDVSFHSIVVPEEAMSNATRFRWWEPSTNGTFGVQWAIDEISITNLANPLPSFYDNGDGKTFKLTPGRVSKSYCGLSKSVTFAETEGIRFAESPDILTSHSTVIQFEIVMGCSNTHCYDVELEYSLDYGRNWYLVRKSCHPSLPDCPESWSSSTFSSDMFKTKSLVTLPAPKIVRSKSARFRLIQKLPWRHENTWAIGKTYIGDECPYGCFGRGICLQGSCQCEGGWKGETCTERSTPLPKFLEDDFPGTEVRPHWHKIVGAKISNICGPVSSGSALHFYGDCTRLAETRDLDLREGLFVQFDLMTGCSDNFENTNSSRDNNILVQYSCNGGITWKTMKEIPLNFRKSKYIWMEIPHTSRCLGGRIRWWQPKLNHTHNEHDWAIDTVVVGGKSDPPQNISLETPDDLKAPLWIRRYNWLPGKTCGWNSSTPIMESTPSEPAIIQTTDIQVTQNHSIHFSLALACETAWDNNVEPVKLEYSRDFGRSWHLARQLCLPFQMSSCNEYRDASIFYAPQNWQYYVFLLNEIGPSKYTRFRWIQYPTPQTAGSHQWSLKDVYIGMSCPHHCMGRGKCTSSQTCICFDKYYGTHCQYVKDTNIAYIKDTFQTNQFLDHWGLVQGGHTAPGCGGEIEEPPAAVFQGKNSRVLTSVPVDTRSSRFVLFTAQIGSSYGSGLCRPADERIHNVFLQYSTNGGINWHLLRELDYTLYRKPQDDYIIMPKDAKSPATIFRFWQPPSKNISPSWTLDNVFIGGSEIATAQFIDRFEGEPTVAEWLFAPHSHMTENYCTRGDNGSLVWEADNPGHRAITTQELIITDGHVIQFKISVGCQQEIGECYNGPVVYLEYSKDGGVSGWDVLKGSCYPETSVDPNCSPYVFHGTSAFGPDLYSSWTRVTIPIPEKAWSSTTHLRWSQNAKLVNGEFERILPWALDDVYVGVSCPEHCRGRGDCLDGICHCDEGYEGESCDTVSTMPTSLIEGFEGKLSSKWSNVNGGSVGIGCKSLEPYGNGKHLYFNGCGTRQAITYTMDTRRAVKVTYVLRIGSHDNTPSCHVDLSNPSTTGNKGIVLQYSSNNGITWSTISVHDPLDFRKARRVAYSLPEDARRVGIQFRWWQPEHGGIGTDQWALDNVEVIVAGRKTTNVYERQNRLW